MVTKSPSLALEVQNILNRHVGRDNPITGKELAKRFNLSNDRNIRLAICELIARGVPVVSSTDFPPGYYIAFSFQEIKDYCDSMLSRLKADGYRINKVRKNFTTYWEKQTRLI